MRKKIAVLTGAGISAESGIQTFRDANGLWEGHDVMQVASPEGYAADPALVLDFYNQRRAQLHTVKPNAGHTALVDLEVDHDVVIITQNVDNLHEAAGSANVLHLHGELLKARSSDDPTLIIPWKTDIVVGDKAADGSQLRPHIVWFGEDVPLIARASELVYDADVVIVIGTSLQVYPAAGLLQYAQPHCSLYLVDVNKPDGLSSKIKFIQEPASIGVPLLVNELLEGE